MREVRLVVLSGLSGSGKSTVLNVLEDMGYFCVDNLPVMLLPKFVELLSSSEDISRAATVVDVRERGFLKDFPAIFSAIKNEPGVRGELVFFEASDEALVKRFSETRRRHPLGGDLSPIEGLRLERELLGELKARADRVIDTTHYNVHQLKEAVSEYFAESREGEKMVLSFVSFGYRYGVPADADLVMDVRFLPNPHFVDSLRAFTGLDERVREFVLSRGETREFLRRYVEFLRYLLPLYMKEGKSYLTVAIGCTGGRHRSVAIADYLASALGSDGIVTRKRFRDMEKT
ncbi:MAG TPA: RNase adapter RapZ [Deltaproteobacteria bacterium]|nr:RNase adapter RapZ [Deltaproteobacteria bacterium]